MNKNLLYIIGIIVLIVLGYFALQNNDIQPVQEQLPISMEQVSETGLEIFKDNIVIPFNKLYSIDDDWSLKIIQFEPDAKISGAGMITSDSDQEVNPAIKIEFYKDSVLIHYQISYKTMPGFHSIKEGQKYLLDLLDYSGYKIMDNNSFSIETTNVKIWRIK